MKTFSKIITVLEVVLILVIIVAFYQLSNKQPQVARTNIVESPATVLVTATMYYPVASQCDSDPLITAGMYKINPKKAGSHKWIAMSRDLLKRWGGDFKYGDRVLIKGAGHKDGYYTVVDTMNKRFVKRIDFLENTGTPLYKFRGVKIYKV